MTNPNQQNEAPARNPPERIWMQFRHFRSRSILVGESSETKRSDDDIEYARVDPPAAPADYVETIENVIRRLEAMRDSPLWNANGYDAALSILLNELRIYPNMAREFERLSAEFVSSLAPAAPDERDHAAGISIANDAAIAMRDACVAKVKAMRGQWHDQYVAADASNREALVGKELLFAKCRAANKIITALQAVTLDQQQEKQS